MSQSSDGPTSGKTDCSEAMEAKISDKARELFELHSRVGKAVSGFVQCPSRGPVRIRIDAMEDDAGNRAVQKTHPENQLSVQQVEAICDAVRSEVGTKFREGIAKDSATLAVNMVSYEVYRLGLKFDCSGPAEGHNKAQAHDGR